MQRSVSTAAYPRSSDSGVSLARHYWPALRLGLIVVGALWAAVVVYVRTRDGIAIDAHAYWLTRSGDLYAVATHTTDDAYLYSPAFAQLISPLTMLPWQPFLEVWTAIQAAAAVLVAGPLTLPVLLTEPALFEIDLANITFMLALAIVASFRWPWAWAFVILTKVTPGVGVLWFAFRREWRSFGIALGATAAVVAVSMLLDAGAWVEWVRVLSIHDAYPGMTTLPLLVRLPLAAALVWWGARHDARWVVPIACLLAMPVIRTTGLVLLVACIPLIRPAGVRGGYGSAPSWRRRSAPASET